MTITVRHGDLAAADLEALLLRPRIAWDIETSGLDPHAAEIGTVQVHAPRVGTFVVQMDGSVPERLRELLAVAEVTKVFHYAPFDLRFMVQAWKVQPTNVACTKMASKLLRPHAPHTEHSLQSLLAEHLHIRISKDERLSDWKARDLSANQLAYAANDVQHLLKLYDELMRQMRHLGLLDLYSRCISFLPTRVELDLGGWPDIYAY